MFTETSVSERVQRLIASPARADLHHLVRIDPFFNRARGMWDTGWSCREHTVMTAALLATEGVASHFIHGANIFVVGPTAAGEPPCGIGNDAPQTVRGHSWVWVEGFGAVDISPRLNDRFAAFPHWRPIEASAGWVGDTWLVEEQPATLIEANGFAEYGQELAKATHVEGGHTAIYWRQEALPFSLSMLDTNWVDSPLRTRLKGSDFDGSLLRLATHLWALNHGRRRPLANVSQAKAWRFVSQIEDGLINEFVEAVEKRLADLG